MHEHSRRGHLPLTLPRAARFGALVAISCALSACGSTTTTSHRHATPAARAKAPAPRITGRVTLGRPVSDTRGGDVLTTDWVAPGGRWMWVINDRGRTLYKVDPHTLAVVSKRRLPASGQAGAAVGLGSVWYAARSGSLLRIDLATGRLQAKIPVGRRPRAVLVAAGHVWVSDRDGFVRRIDPRREAVVGRTRVQRNLYTMVSAPGVVWVTAEDDLDPSVAELDARTGRLLRRIKTDQTVYLAETGGYAAGTLWGALKQGDVARLDPKSGRVVKTVSTDGYSVATDRRHVWVSWPPEGQVQAIDAQTNRAAGPPLKVGAEMEAMAFGFGSVWAADVKNATLTRISA